MSRPVSLTLLLALVVPGGAPLMAAESKPAQRPNIVIMLTDNLGWGEIGIQGSARGVPTPRIDRLAAQGMRLTNFNVEYSCVVSRAALLTGRYAVRTGAAQRSGITLWEVTIAEALKPLATRRVTMESGTSAVKTIGSANASRRTRDSTSGTAFPQTSNEAQITSMPGYDPAKTPPPYIWEGKAGQRGAEGQSLRPREPPHPRPGVRDEGHRVHGTQRPCGNALLPLLPHHAHPLSDPRASRPRGEDRRGRHRRCARRHRPQHGSGAGCDRATGNPQRHHRRLDGGQRCRGSPALARKRRTLDWLLQHRHGGWRARGRNGPLARTHPGGASLERDRARDRSLPDARGCDRSRHRPERPTHRRREPATVPARQAVAFSSGERALLDREQAGTRREMAGLETALRISDSKEA